MKHITLVEGRLYLGRQTKLNHINFTWKNGEHSKGRVKIIRKKLPYNKVIAIFTDLYNRGIENLPDLIGEPTDGGGLSSILYYCKLDGELITKQTTCFGHNSDQKSKDEFCLLKHSIDSWFELVSTSWRKIWV